MKPNVIISIEHNSWYCECCGGISDISVNVKFPDGSSFDAHEDGHFGYGSWQGDMVHIYNWILQKLGYTLICNNEDKKIAYYGNSNNYELVETKLNSQPLTPIKVDITYLTDPEYPNYPYENLITVHLPTETINFQFIPYEKMTTEIPGWQGDWEIIYQKILNEFVNIETIETYNHEDNNPNDYNYDDQNDILEE